MGLRRYSVVSEAEFCYIGLPNLYLGFVGTRKLIKKLL